MSPRVPFDPGRWPFFYGWVIVLAGTGGVLLSFPGQPVGLGLFNDSLVSVPWPRYFGLRHLGQNTGVVTSFCIIGGAFGPLMFGLSRSLTGDFHAAAWGGMILPLLLLPGLSRIRAPELDQPS